MNINSWTFQRKLGAGFAVIVGLALVIAVICVYSLNAVVASNERLLSFNAENLINARKLQAASNENVAAFRGYLLLMEDRFLQQRAAQQQQFAELFKDLERDATTEKSRGILANIGREQTAFATAQEQVIQIRKAQGIEAAQRADSQAVSMREALAGLIASFVDQEQQTLDLSRRESTARGLVAQRLVIGLAGGSVLFAIAAAFILMRSLSRQIGSAVQHVQSSSAELQTAANQQASGARETATAMNEVSTTVNELLATSRQISESAHEVARIAQDATAAAGTGEQTVTKTQDAIEGIRRQVNIIVSHMLDLGKKSQQIGGILDIINEVAEQTNILSINATIEAAGAGEQGKRFAVVGEEIRKLADRVSASTKDIRVLVDEIRAAVNTTVLATEGGSKAVDAGMRQFENVAQAFKEIAAMVTTTTQAAREIELSTKQQMTAMEQVNVAVTGAAQSTRETEVSSSQTVQTATQLAHLSHDLANIVQPHAA